MGNETKEDTYDDETFLSHKGELVTMLQLNCWLIPKLLPNAQASKCVNQEGRAEKIGKLVLKYDIAALQEVWGSSLELLNEPIIKKDTHHIEEESQTWSNYGGYFGDIINTSMGWISGLGGLYFANRNGMSARNMNGEPILARKHSYANSQTWSGKGCRCILLDVSAKWRKHGALLVFTTHLDKHNKKGMQYAQLEELKEFMNEIIEIVYRNIYMKSASKMEKHLSIILTGDFNIPDNTEDYEKLLMPFIEKGAMRDLYKEYGEKKNIELKNTYTKNPLRIDYVFGVDTFSANKYSPQYKFRKVAAAHMDVMQDLNVSDHYPTEISIMRI